MNRRAHTCIMLAALLMGCSQSVPIKAQGFVKGRVLLDGNPLPGGIVKLIPETSSGQIATGQIDAQGYYQAQSSPSQQGVLPGSYFVIVDYWKKAPELNVSPGELGVPKKYTRVDQSGFRVTVKVGGTETLNLEMKSGAT